MQRGDEDLFHTERFDTHASADDIGNGIERANLMEVDVLYGLAVDFALGHGDALENGKRVLLNEGGKLAVLDQLADLLVRAAVGVLVMMMMPMDFAAMIMVVLLPMFMPVLVLMGLVAMGVRVLMLVGMFMRVTVVMAMVVIMIMSAAVLVIMLLTRGFIVMRVFVAMLMLVLVLVGVLMPMFMTVRMGMPVVVLVMPLAMLAMLLILVVRVGGTFVDAEFHAFHLLPLLAVEVHVEIAEIELGKLPLESGRFHAEIDEGADGHVAGDAGKAVEEENFHKRAAGRGEWKRDRCCTGYNPFRIGAL